MLNTKVRLDTIHTIQLTQNDIYSIKKYKNLEYSIFQENLTNNQSETLSNVGWSTMHLACPKKIFKKNYTML